jgi:hypothetical protein
VTPNVKPIWYWFLQANTCSHVLNGTTFCWKTNLTVKESECKPCEAVSCSNFKTFANFTLTVSFLVSGWWRVVTHQRIPLSYGQAPHKIRIIWFTDNPRKTIMCCSLSQCLSDCLASFSIKNPRRTYRKECDSIVLECRFRHTRFINQPLVHSWEWLWYINRISSLFICRVNHQHGCDVKAGHDWDYSMN